MQADQEPREADAAETGDQPRRKASGWFSVDADQVVRGWCRDREPSDQQLDVTVLIDGTPVAELPADRVDPKPLENGEADGRRAFAAAVPRAFYDGAEHEVRVEIATEGYGQVALKSKRAHFTVPPDTPEPVVALSRLGPDGLDGMLTGPAGLREELDVFLDGRRLAEGEAAVEWSWRAPGALPFRIRFPGGQALQFVARDVAVAYPGSTAPPASLADVIEVAVSPLGGEEYRVTLGPGVALPQGHLLMAEIHAEAREGPPLAKVRLEFTDDRATLRLADARAQDRMRLRVLAEDGGRIGTDAAFVRSTIPRRLLGNGAFVRWEGDAPADFTLGPDMVPERGFYAFPPALKTQFGLSGALLSVPLDASRGEQGVMTQSPPPFGDAGRPVEIGLGLLARVSRPTRLVLRLKDGSRTAATLETTLGTRWKTEHRIVTLPPGLIVDPRVELLAEPAGYGEGPVFLEIAGLHCGDPALLTFADEAAGGDVRNRGGTGSDNLVVNADLVHWPAGLALKNRTRRFEVAEGWTLDTRAAGETRIAALPAPSRLPGRYAVSLIVPAEAEAFRLEVALDVRTLTGRGTVRFSARLGEEGSRWGHIDRITLLKRGGTAETVLAMVARRVALTRTWDSFRFDFAVDPAEEDGFAFSTDGVTEYLLVFEVRSPAALDLGELDVRLAAPETGSVPAPLGFEDRAIRAQVAALRGLEGWRGDAVLRPSVRPARTAAPTAEPARWRWSDIASGSVEVAIPVHDAAEETIACLTSLAQAGGMPHTVRIVDDASDEDTRQRIRAFVADRPWMTLDPNDRHLGYTATANRAVLESRADWVVLLNSDTVVSAGWMEGLLEAAARDPATAFVGPVSNAATYQSVPELYDGASKWAVNALPPGCSVADMAALVAERADHAFPVVPLLNGFCTLIRRQVFADLGGFDARAFPEGYGEENDLGIRAARAGHRLRVADHVYVHHLKSRSFGPARRGTLSKAGDKALRALHPDVDFAALGRAYLATPALHALRERIAAAYPPAVAPAPAPAPEEAA